MTSTKKISTNKTIYTVESLLNKLPSNFAKWDDKTVFNTTWKDFKGNDYAIEILPNNCLKVSHTGNVSTFKTLTEAKKYMGVR